MAGGMYTKKEKRNRRANEDKCKTWVDVVRATVKKREVRWKHIT